MPRKKTESKMVPEVPMEIPAEEVPTEKMEQQQISLNDLRMGYVVGITPGGEFVFELLGQSKGLVELLGLHRHATKKVDRIYEDNQMLGDRLVHEVGKAVALINQKVDRIVEKIAPIKPANIID